MSWTWMLILIGLIIIACVAAAIITVRISKQVERKQEKYDEEGETFEDELERSHEYEVQSLKSNLPNLIKINVTAVVIAVAVFIVLFLIFG